MNAPMGPVGALARRGAFRLGAAEVRPASRELCGANGCVSVEPRIMQVLIMLADAGGAVVTRADLMAACWNGQIVGDDALNRSFSEIRRLARQVADASFVVETIPKVGYRLVGARAAPAGGQRPAPPQDDAAVHPADGTDARRPAVHGPSRRDGAC
ncbi:MAG: winged helix-turn-helix domain-containing protein [Sphingomonadaceae bacterium]|nr:winged helix-turn-helix domain-containing protein [Sphingomonadaceae bacterium]